MFSPKERKGRKTSNNKQQHQNAVIVATGFVHFVSDEMSECSHTEHQMLTYFDEFTFPGLLFPQVVIPILWLSVL
jgi:hypothetical protein